LRISLEWLREYVDIDLDTDELADILSMSGSEVERVHRLGSGVSGVVVARVTEVAPHPNADSLRIATVEDGTVSRLIVCGAPNLAEGMNSALAVPGATLPAVSAEPLRAVNIRGVDSEGMLLSDAELGISDDHSGIIELGGSAQIGLDIHEVLPLDDVVLDLEITPNRPDCMSMIGIAREVTALTGGRLRMPDFAVSESGGNIEDLVTVRIEDVQGCPRYTARVVTDVEIGPSPPWMQRRLVASGLRSINNVVDITNYVLIELGQPLHAFDLELLGGSTIIVRRAADGEPITTLDGVDRELDDQSLVIADISRPVALAGVIGGEDSEVRDTSRNILIESAYFDPTSILLTSKRLGVRTEASARFEKGCDPEGTRNAADRAAYLMASLAGGSVAVGVTDEYPQKITPVAIDLRTSMVNRVLGTNLLKTEMVRILENLEIDVEETGFLRVTVPTFRPDLTREIDLTEEIARVHGYGKIPSTLPAGGGFYAGYTTAQVLETQLLQSLISQGLSQVVNYSFMRRGDLDNLQLPADDRLRVTLELANPLAETGELMRTTLLPALLRMAAGNINKGNKDLAVFEMGRVFIARAPEELPEEIETIGILMCGLAEPPGWSIEARQVDFFDLKGTVEDACHTMGVKDLNFVPDEKPFLLSGYASRVDIGDVNAGFIGQLNPQVAEGFGLDCDIYVSELFTDAILQAAAVEKEYQPVGRFPNVKVDIAAVVDESTDARHIDAEIKAAGGELLRSVRLFDVYTGPQIPEGKKSLAYALEFGSPHGTLTDDEAHAQMDRVIEALESKFAASIRGREMSGEEGS
jgi:phenylalanyl-tRNA synthetase beta chain